MKKPGVRSKRIADAFLTYAILLVVSVVFLFPCLWLVLSCFSESGSIYSFNGFFPTKYSFNSFVSLFTNTYYDYMSWFGNTLLVAVKAVFWERFW